MNIEDLYTFNVVAQKKSISRSAEHLNSVQSNITARIKRLETEYNTPLFYRHRQGVTLTPTGSTLLGYTEKILNLLEESKKVIKHSEYPTGSLKIGSMETTAAVRLPSILSEFNDLYPEVDLNLHTGTTEELIKSVMKREIDGGFIADRSGHTSLEEIPVFREQLELLSKDPSLVENTVEELKNQKIIVFKSGCFYRKTLEDWLLSEGIVSQKVMELNTLDGIIGCVKAGLGITMLTKSVANQLDYTQKLFRSPLPYKNGEVITYFVYRKDIVKTPAFVKFVELLSNIEIEKDIKIS